MDLASYIEELLYENDCVILPTIGGFIVNPTTAQIDFVEQQLCPPTKAVSFNPKLVNNDGLLVHSISQKQHISYKQAQSDLETYTRKIEGELFNNQIVHFNNIGKLYFNSDSKLEFVPDETNFLRAAYGLPTISCAPILRSKDYLQQPQTAAASMTRRSKRKAAWITPLRVAAVAAIFLFIFSLPYLRETLFSTTTSNEIAATELTTDVPTTTKETKVASASILPSSSAVTEEEETPAASVITPVEEAPVELNVAEETNPAVGTENYIIVLGAFGKEKNAYRLAAKLAKDNYLPDVTIKNGLNRVGVQLTCSPEELKMHLQFLQDNYNKKAWVVD